MILHKPSYYDSFKCIADKCPFTCCREWKIAVDDATRSKWENMNIPKEACRRNNISMKEEHNYSLKTITVLASEQFEELAGDNDYVIELNENGLCPMLNECGLCDIVLEYGEDNISNTCHTFPREEHLFDDFKELTLAAGCPAVLDLLWKQKTFEYYSYDEENNEFIRLRDNILDIFKHYSCPEKAVKMSFFILLDILDAFENNDYVSNMVDNSFDKNFLSQLSDKIDTIEGDNFDTVFEQNELFLDLCDNYRKKGIYKDIIEELACVAEMYEDTLSEKLYGDRMYFESLYKDSLSKYLSLLMQEEVYSTLYMPEGDFYSMTLKLQWLGITLAVIRQCCFLFWKKYGKLEYDDIRQVILVIIRMTGYSEEDIEEYLENSFEEIIWDWGYMSLIMGTI